MFAIAPLFVPFTLTVDVAPDVAKASVLEFAGRHNPDFAWNFDNSTDDASYAVNEELNSALLAHTTGLTKIGQ